MTNKTQNIIDEFIKDKTPEQRAAGCGGMKIILESIKANKDSGAPVIDAACLNAIQDKLIEYYKKPENIEHVLPMLVHHFLAVVMVEVEQQLRRRAAFSIIQGKSFNDTFNEWYNNHMEGLKAIVEGKSTDSKVFSTEA